LLRKPGKPDDEVSASLQYSRQIIETPDRDLYAIFEGEARRRLRGRDEDDWPVLAAALALDCPIWSEDTDFFGTGVAIWTTNRAEIFLEAQVRSGKSTEPE